MRYARVQIGALYLTSDGTQFGAPCRCRVENEAAFASSLSASTVLAVDATPHTQVFDRGVRGIELTVVIEYCPETLLASLVSLLNNALQNLSTVRVTVQSLSDFDVQAVVQSQPDGSLYAWESRSGGIVKGVSIKFISAGIVT